MLDSFHRPIPDEARRQIVSSLRAAGAEARRAEEATDLACHACEQAMRKLTDTVETGADGGIKLMALEIGLQMLTSQAVYLSSLIQRFSQEKGLSQHEIQVRL